MTTPKLADDSNGNHRIYRNPQRPGDTYDSVTWATGTGMPKWGLEVARRKLIAHCAWSEFSSFINKPEAEAMAFLLNAPEREWGGKRDLGSAVHHAAERLFKGEPLSVWDDEVVPYLQSMREFFEDYRPKLEHVEVTLFNDDHLYAGTVDWIGTVDGMVLGDWKTGRSLYPESALQLTGYAHCSYGIDSDSGEVLTIPRVETGMLVHLTPEGYRVGLVDLTDPYLWQTFLAALFVARFEGWGSEAIRYEQQAGPAETAHGWDVAGLMAAIEKLSLEDKMLLSVRFSEEDIPTVPATWTDLHVQQVRALLDGLPFGRPIDRPIP